MRSTRFTELQSAQALAGVEEDLRRLWTVTDPLLRALHRGRVEGAIDVLLALGAVSQDEASGLRSAISLAADYARS